MTHGSPGARRPHRPGFTRLAAYVLCVDAVDRLLLTRLSDRTARPGWWTLPGGGVEFGEHPEVAALRELTEETGLTATLTELLTVDSIVRDLDPPDAPAGTYHSVRVVYRASITGGELRDEPEGESTDRAAWVARSELERHMLVELGELAVRLAFREDHPS